MYSVYMRIRVRCDQERVANIEIFMPRNTIQNSFDQVFEHLALKI
jgi:hypothetical protein